MKCLVCHEPQPGPHRMSCRRSERMAAARRAASTSAVRAELRDGSTPWGEKPTVSSMLARLEAFCARYAATCSNSEKADEAREPMPRRG
jgi:hypothetical protein